MSYSVCVTTAFTLISTLLSRCQSRVKFLPKDLVPYAENHLRMYQVRCTARKSFVKYMYHINIRYIMYTYVPYLVQL